MLPRSYNRSYVFRSIILVCVFVVVLQLGALYGQRPAKKQSTGDPPVKQQIPSPDQPPNQTHDQPATVGTSWRRALTVDGFNELFESRLKSCMMGLSCPGNTDKLILLDWVHFSGVFQGLVQGEHIWCGSMMDSIYQLGYSMLISTDKNNVYDYFRRYHNNVHILIQGEDSDTKCADDPRCIYVDASSSASSLVPPPNGTHLNLPIWKLFHATWWNPIAGAGPLHAAFTLSPEPYGQYGGSKTYYLGYSVEPTCLNIPFVTWSERPRQAYIMGKELRYFLDPKYPLTDSVGGIPAQMRDDFYRVFSEEEDSTFLAGQFDLSGAEGYAEPPPGIVQHARMERTEFQKLISKSRVMMGIGNPVLSPTPYEALCLGIPFINPIFGWNKADPANRNFWDGQHPALIVEGVDEPYVYHVKVGDRVGLKAALKKAMNTTIDRFVPPRMTVKAVLERTKTLLETDWRSIAKQQMLAMHSDGQKIEPDKYIDSS